MLTDPLEETLSFVEESIKKQHRPPRLKEYVDRLGITKKAVLDRLRKLESLGVIEMPDGVLSVQLKGYTNDIFISYSREDQAIAEEVYKYFEDEGFKVWKDNLNIEVGDDITAEVFNNITRAKCVLVLLSGNSVTSRFVEAEVSTAAKSELDKGMPVILPIIIDEKLNKDRIFSSIYRKNYYKLPENFTVNDLSLLADKVHISAYAQAFKDVPKVSTKNYNKLVKKAKALLLNELEEKGHGQRIGKYAHKEFSFAPLESLPRQFSPQQLQQIIRETHVQTSGWGGDRFPYYHFSSQSIVNMDGWISETDIYTLPDHEWSLFHWSLDQNLNLFSHASLREEFSGSEKLNGKVSMEWLILDITRAIVFVRNLQEKTGIKKWRFEMRYDGIKNKELAILSWQRMGFMSSYKSKENTIIRSADIDDLTDLEELAFKLCVDVLTIFNWNQPSEKVIRKDVGQVFQGRFPE